MYPPLLGGEIHILSAEVTAERMKNGRSCCRLQRLQALFQTSLMERCSDLKMTHGYILSEKTGHAFFRLDWNKCQKNMI